MKKTLPRALASLLSVAGALLSLACSATEEDACSSLCGSAADDGEHEPAPDESDELCEDFCRVRIACGDRTEIAADCIEDCRDELDAGADISSGCGREIEALVGCLSRLDCADYDDYWLEPTTDYPCAERDEDVGRVCDGTGTAGGTDSGGEECIAYGESCSINGDCCEFDEGGALCVGNVCSPICLDDSDCAAGSRCADLVDLDGNPIELNACLPDDGGPSDTEDECEWDGDCPSHEICTAGRCQYADCTSDAHCSGCNRCVSNYCSYCGEGPYGCYC
jgi:hypothetical protein